MPQQIKSQNTKPLCKITINYEDSVRCIDLENILTSFRMLSQHAMAEKTLQSTRTFTSAIKIQSIEKGSIDIQLILDLFGLVDNVTDVVNFVNSNEHDWIDIAKFIYDLFDLYRTGKNVADKLKFYIKSLESAASHVKSILIKDKNNTTKLESDNNGNVKVSIEENKSASKD